MIKRFLVLSMLTAPVVLPAQGRLLDSLPHRDTIVAQITVVPSIDFSGVLYANYQYRGEKGPTKDQNKFDLERVYLTFKMPVGDNAGIRVTTDVFQQSSPANDGYYKGWVVRAKYAYLQYNFTNSFNVRGGLLQNVVIEHMESFWPRWISQTAVERSGFFSSADAGVSGLISLPHKLGEIYTTVVNGPGYTSREVDRFKDYAARLTLTPISGPNATVALTAWTYQGAIASRFSTVGSSLHRIRSGLMGAVRTPVLTAGVESSIRKDGSEQGANTFFTPRVVFDTTGRLTTAYALFKPTRLGLIGRLDEYKPNRVTSGYIRTVIGGLVFDLTKKSALSLDYQEQIPRNGAVAVTSKTYYLHLVANF